MCCPEPISLEMAQLLTSQLSQTLANTFYLVKEMCGILESLFFFYPFRTVIGGSSLTQVLNVCHVVWKYL